MKKARMELALGEDLKAVAVATAERLEMSLSAYVRLLIQNDNTEIADVYGCFSLAGERTMVITVSGKDYILTLTCDSCPEQYDVELEGQEVGYLRLRHGLFTAQFPDVEGREVYEAETDGDGYFTDEERDRHLRAAIEAIDKARSET
jgi:hypothetical protein